ncbi:MAG: Gfo/Idh/MocA family oxidoreductase [Planctomycetota bacterium]|nr:Gfo/Idh/MocA family oxidoreductase [Planctomycetota bacterium]
MRKSTLTRRAFLGTAAAAAAFTIVPRCAVAASGETPPNDKVRIAGIGVGGQGRGDLDQWAGENIVALCDVDLAQAGDVFKKYPAAKPYRNFRKMFDEMENQIDAVLVATPDHTHAVAAMAAIQRRKHVYCEKPLAHSVAEVRALMRAAREKKVITQVGNQGHSTESIRMFCEWIWDGAIGSVHTVHAGCGMNYSKIRDLGKLSETPLVPPTLDWDLWLGPTPHRPYHPMYVPGTWRSWLQFGTGVIGDWVCHVVDPVFWALDLGAPATIQAQAKDYDPKTQGETCPRGEIITYEFAAKGKRGPVTLHWYSGKERIPRPPELEEGRNVTDTGAVVLGDRGAIMYGSHGAGGVRIIPEAKMKEYKLPEKTIPRAKEHHQDWIRAIRSGKPAGSDFSYGGPLTEIALLGAIAVKKLGTKLAWDGQMRQFTNCPEANVLLDPPPFRAGWKL